MKRVTCIGISCDAIGKFNFVEAKMFRNIKVLCFVIPWCAILLSSAYVLAEVGAVGASNPIKIEIIKKSLVRTEPSFESKVIGTMHAGAFDVLATSNNKSGIWHKIRSRKYGREVWINSINTKLLSVVLAKETKKEVSSEAKTTDIEKFENLEGEIDKTIEHLKDDREKILAAIEGLSRQKCQDEAKKSIVGMTYESSVIKDRSLSALTSQAAILTQEIDKLVKGYSDKAVAIKQLEDKRAQISLNKKILVEIQSIVGNSELASWNTVSASEPTGLEQLNRRIDSALAIVSSPAKKNQAQSEKLTKASLPPGQAGTAAAVPQWVVDSISSHGQKIATKNYGETVLAVEDATSIMAVGKQYADKFMGDYGDRIKDRFEDNKYAYFVLLRN